MPARPYAREVHKELKYLATWFPNARVRLGDVGLMGKHLFRYKTNLESLGIPFEADEPGNAADYDYNSSRGVDVKFKLSGQLPVAGSVLTEAEAGVTIEFNRKDALVLHAVGCTIHRIKDQAALEEKIKAAANQGTWKRQYYVVTELVEAKSATIVVSRTNGGKVELLATGNVGAHGFNLANVDAGLKLVSSKSVDEKFIAEKGLTPLFRAQRLRTTFFGDEELEATGLDIAQDDSVPDFNGISVDDLYDLD